MLRVYSVTAWGIPLGQRNNRRITLKWVLQWWIVRTWPANIYVLGLHNDKESLCVIILLDMYQKQPYFRLLNLLVKNFASCLFTFVGLDAKIFPWPYFLSLELCSHTVAAGGVHPPVATVLWRARNNGQIKHRRNASVMRETRTVRLGKKGNQIALRH